MRHDGCLKHCHANGSNDNGHQAKVNHMHHVVSASANLAHSDIGNSRHHGAYQGTQHSKQSLPFTNILVLGALMSAKQELGFGDKDNTYHAGNRANTVKQSEGFTENKGCQNGGEGRAQEKDD